MIAKKFRENAMHTWQESCPPNIQVSFAVTDDFNSSNVWVPSGKFRILNCFLTGK